MQTEQLIERLTAQLEPVRVLRAPAWRALLWLMMVAAVSAALILRFAPLPAILPRLAVPRIAVECVATALTAVTAIIAAFQLSVPDRSPRWLWLPLPPFLLWLAASGLGCLRNGLSLRGPHGFFGDSPHCFAFITCASVPLAVGLFWMLRRARPINALPVAAAGTLGVAATAAFVLQFFHPFDVTVIDLALHLSAIGLVVLLGTAWRRPLLDASIEAGRVGTA
ncbi:MAG: NrsF family protein [Steroidobacterales bacterium]